MTDEPRFNRDDVSPGLSGPLYLPGSLREICPQFGYPEIIEEVRVADVGFHCVMLLFSGYLGRAINTLSDQQLCALGNLIINEAVSIDDDLENAVSTCLLEHLHQINCLKSLSRYLSTKAKGRTRA